MKERNGVAWCGVVRTDLFKALTASLCSHTTFGALNHTQRMGTLYLFASSIHSFLPSECGFVLSNCPFLPVSVYFPVNTLLVGWC